MRSFIRQKMGVKGVKRGFRFIENQKTGTEDDRITINCHTEASGSQLS